MIYRLSIAPLILLTAAACGSSSKAASDAGLFASRDTAHGVDSPGDRAADRAVAPSDAGHADASPDAHVTVPEAAPEAATAADAARNGMCTPLSSQTGTAVSGFHGRMDGTLVYVVPQGGPSSCNGDDSHVHLQVQMSGAVYDVAVDIGKSGDEEGYEVKSLAPPGGAWSEGWHGSDNLGYPALGLSSGQFTTLAPADLSTEIEALLAGTSEVSVYCIAYTQRNGCHDVHYKDGNGGDGAIVLNPMAATPSILFFHFANQSF